MTMDEPSNEQRAEWAYAAVEAFACKTRQDSSGDLKHDLECVVSDLLCDLMHLSDRDGFDFDRAMNSAAGNYQEELVL